MTEAKRIEVDIGAALAALQESPELCAAMTEMVGGPALVEAQAEIERLAAMFRKVREIALAGFRGDMDGDQALCDINNMIVADMKARGENPTA